MNNLKVIICRHTMWNIYLLQTCKSNNLMTSNILTHFHLINVKNIKKNTSNTLKDKKTTFTSTWISIHSTQTQHLHMTQQTTYTSWLSTDSYKKSHDPITYVISWILLFLTASTFTQVLHSHNTFLLYLCWQVSLSDCKSSSKATRGRLKFHWISCQ